MNNYIDQYLKCIQPVYIKINNTVFSHVQLADTQDKIIRGLMFRKQITDPDYAMLFLFSDLKTRNFWMKNCLFPITVIFLDQKKKIITAYNMPVQHGCLFRHYSSIKPAKYAIQIPTYAKDKSTDILTLLDFTKDSNIQF